MAKYLIGQAPSYASYIALGCGAQPLDTVDEFGDYSNKQSLDFEMFRIPIDSRGYVVEDGVSKIVLTGSLPTEERYEITEVGIFSAGANPSAGAYDSKTLYSFTELWEYHNATQSIAIPSIVTSLSSSNDGIIDVTPTVFQTNADNKVFSSTQRIERNERSRFLNNIIMIRGDEADLGVETVGGTSHIVLNSGNHIHLTDTALDFAKNSPTDEIRFAFSVVNKVGDSTATPDKVRILVEFASTDVHNDGQWARFEVILDDYDFSTNRYIIATKKLEDIYKSSSFTWDAVNVVRVYACVIDNDEPSLNYYVSLDAIRLENVNTINPLYGLTGYTVIKTENAQPIVKSPNTSNYIEFRFGMDVL